MWLWDWALILGMALDTGMDMASKHWIDTALSRTDTC